MAMMKAQLNQPAIATRVPAITPATFDITDFTRPPMIIGIGGRAGTGKSTMSSVIMEMLMGMEGMRPRMFHFATPIKHIICDLLTKENGDARAIGKDVVDAVYGRSEERSKLVKFAGYDVSPRALMQWFGQGLREIVGLEVWIRLLHMEMLYAMPGPNCDALPVFIIDDVRHINEIDYVLDRMGGQMFWFEGGTADGHPSEECRTPATDGAGLHIMVGKQPDEDYKDFVRRVMAEADHLRPLSLQNRELYLTYHKQRGAK